MDPIDIARHPPDPPWLRYSGTLSEHEEREFIRFFHRLIGVAFATIRPYFLQPLAVESKADLSPVTQADRQTELALRTLISERYPRHAVLGEEFGARAGGPFRWVLDPIDGTRAFVSNCFLFGTLIALERQVNDGTADDGSGAAGFVPVLGCVAHCATGAALIGHRGGTTLFLSDGTRRKVRMRGCERLQDATVLSTSTWVGNEQKDLADIEGVARAARMYRTWGDCFGYFSLATGGADVMLDPQLKHWDVAAVVPVIEGAGGRVTSWAGGSPLRDSSLIATAGGVHDQVLELLRHSSSPATTRMRNG
ncbi:MAG: histidinol-phosphatase [Burkholderiaceae bacterium]|nr:histidinol-phosphatase [Burkholderiaceae bacterium]